MKINLIRTYEDKVHEMSRQYILKSKRLRIKQKEIAEMLNEENSTDRVWDKAAISYILKNEK